MTDTHIELLDAADQLVPYAGRTEIPEVKEPLDRLWAAATAVGKAWSGSWLGYHANVYFHTLDAPPPGNHFSQEWGGMRSGDGWREFDSDQLVQAIRSSAASPDLTAAERLAEEARATFQSKKPEILSMLTTALAQKDDPFLAKLKSEVEGLELLTRSDVVRGMQPSGSVWSRDTLALTQGLWTPPHIRVLAEVVALRSAPKICANLGQISRRAGSHLARKSRIAKRSHEIGTNVFIGHGRSSAWRDLKDFIQDRLGLPWDEFNRVPVAGVTNIARLSEMLDAAAIAFIVMTGEDELTDGKLHARMNAVHEAGLFQGRLGFTKAIILLEEGCEEFTNIQGLGQIRFSKNNMKSAFEEVRQVLEREGLLASS